MTMKMNVIYSNRAVIRVFMMLIVLLVSVQGLKAQNGANQITRADIMAMSPPDQRDVFIHYTQYTITDLVNWTPATANSRSSLIYMTDDDFNALTNVNRQVQIITNPATYIIVDDPSYMPLIQIPLSVYNSLPPAQQEDIKNSGLYEIIP